LQNGVTWLERAHPGVLWTLPLGRASI
jgi:hypothetical protein